jgi:hypothetical protein
VGLFDLVPTPETGLFENEGENKFSFIGAPSSAPMDFSDGYRSGLHPIRSSGEVDFILHSTVVILA